MLYNISSEFQPLIRPHLRLGSKHSRELGPKGDARLERGAVARTGTWKEGPGWRRKGQHNLVGEAGRVAPEREGRHDDAVVQCRVSGGSMMAEPTGCTKTGSLFYSTNSTCVI